MDYSDFNKQAIIDTKLHEMIEALNAAVHDNPEPNQKKIVTCKSTKYGPGCGHDVNAHTGLGSVNQECDCCTWRHNWPELNPDSTVDTSKKDHAIIETKARTPEELAAELGVTMAEIPAILMQQMQVINQALGDVTRRMQPNRAQRRAAARGKAGAPRYKNGRSTY